MGSGVGVALANDKLICLRLGKMVIKMKNKSKRFQGYDHFHTFSNSYLGIASVNENHIWHVHWL